MGKAEGNMEEKHMKRVTLLLLTMLMILVAITGCKSNTSQEDKEKSTESLAVNKPDTHDSETQGSQEDENQDDIFLVPRSIQKGGETLWGYVDLSDPYSEFIIEPIYTGVELFQDANAIVTLKDSVGIINKNGEFSVPLGRYDFIETIYNGYSIASNTSYNADGSYNNHECYIIDVKGKVYDATKGDMEAYYNYIAGLKTFVKYSSHGDLAYFDTETLLMVDIKSLTNPVAYNYILQTALPLSVNQALVPYFDEVEELYGYQNQSGEKILDPIYHTIEAFDQGVAIVSILDPEKTGEFGDDEFYGVIDESGHWVIEPNYYFISRLGDKHFAVTPLNEYASFLKDYQADYLKSALFDLSGKQLMENMYYAYQVVSEEMLAVSDGKQMLFLDMNGAQLKNRPVFDYEGLVTQVGEILIVEIPEVQIKFYYDLTGELLYTDNVDIQLNEDIAVRNILQMPYMNTIYVTPQIIISGDPDREKRINDSIRENVSFDINTMPENPEEGAIISVDQSTIKVTLTGNILNFETSGYYYAFGAAHGGSYFYYDHLNASTGIPYQLSELFFEGTDYQTILAQIMKDQYLKEGNIFMYTDDPIEIESILRKEEYDFSIDQKGIEIHFSEYEIASYAEGMPSFKISFSELADILDQHGEFYQNLTLR